MACRQLYSLLPPPLFFNFIFFSPPSVHKLYLSLVMFLTGFNAKTLTMCAYLHAIVSRPRSDEEGTEQTNAKRKKKKGGKKRKRFREAIHFLLLTVLCERHALTNYTTVSSWCVSWRSSLALCFAFSFWSSGVHTSGPIISHCLGTWVSSGSRSINHQGIRRCVWNIHK